MTGPLILMAAGVALLWLGSRKHHTRAERRAGLRFLWDLTVGASRLGVFSAWMLAPRVTRGKPSSRPKPPRMVQTMSSDLAD